LDAVTAHFRHEERLMASTGFANHVRHTAAHQSFLADLQRFKGALAKSGITPDFRRWAIGRMREWFRFHVVANDVDLGRHLLAHETAARAQAETQPHA
jgi:hemerythrin